MDLKDLDKKVYAEVKKVLSEETYLSRVKNFLGEENFKTWLQGKGKGVDPEKNAFKFVSWHNLKHTEYLNKKNQIESIKELINNFNDFLTSMQGQGIEDKELKKEVMTEIDRLKIELTGLALDERFNRPI